MKTFTTYVTSISLAIVFVLVAVLAPVSQVSAHDGEDHDTVTQAQTSEESNNQSATYRYVAQPGDSYSLMARKAVQTYGITNKVNLSQAQIIYAETNLTKEAGSPKLNQGQAVEIKQETVKSWVEKADDLTDAQEAAWSRYAQNANFNTNGVGQAK